MSFVICFAIFPEVPSMYFVMCVVTSKSLQSGAFVNADFRDLAISTKSLICLSQYAICSCCFLVIRASFEDDQ